MLVANPLLRTVAVVALVFGAMTVVSGARVLLGLGSAREAAGAYVPFVLWFNVAAGFAYIATGLGLWTRRSWAPVAALAILCATLIVFALLGLHVLRGGEYEVRTVAAMTLRSGVWALIALVAWRAVPRSNTANAAGG
jgi:hypothetical protein